MSNKDFLSMQLGEAEDRAAKAKDNLGKTASREPKQKHQQDTSASRTSPVSTMSSPTIDEQSAGSARPSGNGGRTGKDWRKVKRRRRTHSLTFSDAEWEEMVSAARRNDTDVSKMLSVLWEKKGRKLFK